MLGLFLLCALLPTVLLAVIGYRYTSSQLRQQSQARLREVSKATGMAIIERLQMGEEELRGLTGRWSGSKSLTDSRFTGAALIVQGRRVESVGDSVRIPAGLTTRQREHLSGGGSIIMTVPGRQTRVMMARAIDQDPDEGMIWAELDRSLLWGPTQDDSDITLCVTTATGAFLTCPNEMGDSEWLRSDESQLAGFWTAFLGFQWAAPSWTVLLSQPRSTVLAPMDDFKRTFLGVIAVALILVFLLSNIQIRRRMEPLARLQQGTQRVALGNFSEPVRVDSGDEFEQLALSFNSMAHRLGRQFTSLSVINDIGRAALMETKTERVMAKAVSRMGELLPQASVGFLLGSSNPGHWQAFDGQAPGAPGVEIIADLKQWLGDESDLVVSGREARGLRSGFPGMTEDSRVLLLPLRDHDQIAGVIVMVFPAASAVTSVEISQARQTADQVALALASSRLVERLDQLSWGTLSALARTIDANSPWTAGHSERVTMFSMAIGRELGLPERDLDLLHRGGLLHDIGKISVPPALLDKPAKLTDEEMEVIKSHPAVGSRILAPISVFRDIIPIVRHHHEKFDGTGYPDRLAGREIPYLARVVAVADVYDALISDRPYRSGWTSEAAVELITRNAGSHHDPEIVTAFLAALANGSMEQSSLPAIGSPAVEFTLAAGAVS
jgi:putative nucleotidyltransferase with HDIG domain